jgi:hypothetical protein
MIAVKLKLQVSSFGCEVGRDMESYYSRIACKVYSNGTSHRTPKPAASTQVSPFVSKRSDLPGVSGKESVGSEILRTTLNDFGKPH